MPYAVTMAVDLKSAKLLEAIRLDLAQNGISVEYARLNQRPHLTIAIYGDALDPTYLISSLRRRREEFKRCPLKIPAIGTFSSAIGSVCAFPVASFSILSLHASVVQHCSEHLHPHYRAGEWMPHITIAKEIACSASLISAFGRAIDDWSPIEAELVQLSVIRFRPVTVLWENDLTQ